MLDAVVIGAGLFGSVLARALTKAKLNLLVVDAACANAGSAPAACLMRPSWFSALGKSVYEPALRQLDDLVGVNELMFKTRVGSVKVNWCDPKKLLIPRDNVLCDNVTGLISIAEGWQVVLQSGDPISARMVVVAAGIWTSSLFPEIDVVGQAGIAWLWPKARIAEPFIQVWAPYKQLVAFNRGDGLWVGDGTSVRNWLDKYRIASLARCRSSIEESLESAVLEPMPLFGYRPYLRGVSPCMFKQVRRGIWVATGGAKNGTIAAGWCADQLLRAI